MKKSKDKSAQRIKPIELDRAGAPAETSGANASGEAATNAEDNVGIPNNNRDITSVSYTHLTLPTIYSV